MTTLDKKIEKVLKEFDNKLTNEWVGFYNKGNDLIQIKTPEIYNFLRSSIRKVVKESLKEEKELCKKIFINEVDWDEWAISDEEAGEDFENYHKKYLGGENG